MHCASTLLFSKSSSSGTPQVSILLHRFFRGQHKITNRIQVSDLAAAAASRWGEESPLLGDGFGLLEGFDCIFGDGDDLLKGCSIFFFDVCV